MQTMLEMPDNPIPQFEVMFLENLIVENIERKDISVLDIVGKLPTDRPLWGKDSYELLNDWIKFIKIFAQISCLFIDFTNVVWWRRDNELGQAIWQSIQRLQTF